MSFLGVFLLLAVSGFLLYHAYSKWIWMPILAVLLLVASVLHLLGVLSFIMAWLLFLSVSAFIVLSPLRRQLFARPLFALLHPHMPKMSDTEREAIEAGDLYWEKELFRGRPDLKTLRAMPAASLSDEEFSFLAHQVTTLCAMIDDWKIVSQSKIPKKVWNYLRTEKFFSMIIAKEYGGLGFSAYAHSCVVAKIASRSTSVAVTMMVPNSLGPGELLAHYGTQAQKDYYLPRLATGEEVPCFALTAPESGSDASAMLDRGVVCKGEYEGKNVLGMRLTWDKRYITLAPVATVIGLAFYLEDPDGLLGSKKNRGITLCLLPATHPGVEIGKCHHPLNLAFMNGPTRGKDVFVPLEWVIGGRDQVGQGWRMLMELLSVGRAISLPAMSSGSGCLAYKTTGAYASVRKQFRVPIGRFEGVQEAMAQIGGGAYLLEACRQFTAAAVDQGLRPVVASAIAKYHMTETARSVMNHAMDVHAGRAIQTGPHNYLFNTYMGLPAGITVEGANILTRNLIIFGQGAVRCHPHAYREMQYLQEKSTPETVRGFDKALLSHIGYSASCIVRMLWWSLTAGRSPWPETNKAFRQLKRLSTALACVSDLSMISLGGQLKRRERLSSRLGDVMSYLYLASAALAFHHRQADKKTSDIYLAWVLQTCFYKAQNALDDFFSNFPIRWLRPVFRLSVFPWGLPYRKPSDKMDRQIATHMMQPSEFRASLTQFVAMSDEDPVGMMERALEASVECQALLKEIDDAVSAGTLPRRASLGEQIDAALESKLISRADHKRLKVFERLYLQAIAVDEF